MFHGGQVEQAGTGWATRPAKVRLPSLDHEVIRRPPASTRSGRWGKGTQFLDVTVDWSDKLGEGETEHVTDGDAAYEMTWGKIAAVLN